MKKTFRILASLLMLLLILASIFWYLFVYDREFTRDTLLSQARFHDLHGNAKMSSMFYNMAYTFSDHDENVAIELANQYKADGNYTKAEYTLTNAINSSPTPELYAALSRAYVEQNKLLDAVNLLDNIGNPAIQEKIQAMRPTTPAADSAAGYYSQYMDIHLSSTGKYIFYTVDGDYPSTTGLYYRGAVPLPAGETTIYAIAVDEEGLVSPLTVLSYTITGVIEPVRFYDPAMEGAIRELIGVGGDKAVYTNQLWDITEFTAPEGVSTFKDLQQLPYLKKLTIQNQSIDSLEHLSSLISLSSLDLSGCKFQVEEMEILASLPALKELNLSNCGLSTIAGLANAQVLTHLDVSNNTIRNLEVLSPMSTLVEINLDHNAVNDLTALGSLPSLQTLKLNYNAVSSLAPLASCIKLSHLEADHNQITTLYGIGKLPLLSHLSVDYNQLVDISIVSSLTELTNLSIASNSISDISGLYTLTKLEIFDFSSNQIPVLPNWPEGCALQTIDGSYNALTSIDVLKNMQHLTHIYMDYNLLTNIDALADNFCLVQVNVYGNAIPDVEKLRDHDIIVNYDPTVKATEE